MNAAARMQTEAQPGRLCVTARTWKELERSCRGRSRGTRDIKGKGRIELFEVESVVD